MTKEEMAKDIEKMELVENGESYKIYRDDASGNAYEIDYDGGAVIAIYAIDEFGVATRIAY